MNRTGIIQIDVDDAGMAWGEFPQDLWAKILRRFLRPRARWVGFGGIETSAAISRLRCLSRVKLVPAGTARVEMHRALKGRRKASAASDIALFALDKAVLGAIEGVEFWEWSATSDSCPSDTLYFLDQDRLIIEATPFENTLTYSNLQDDEVQALKDCDERLPSALRDVPGLSIEVALKLTE